jgi:hypothetical protein
VASAQLRPGSLIAPSDCTAGFLFVDPVRRVYYLGTAAHCTYSADGTRADATGTRVSLKNADTGATWGEIGTVVYDSDVTYGIVTGQENTFAGIDFSLIELDAGIHLVANPQVIEQAGPTGVARCADAAAGDPVGFYGHGTVSASTGVRARSGYVQRCIAAGEPNATVEVALPVSGGDSGGPGVHQGSGKAIGHAVAGLAAEANFIPMDLLFSVLAESGYPNLRLATVDGGYAGP